MNNSGTVNAFILGAVVGLAIGGGAGFLLARGEGSDVKSGQKSGQTGETPKQEPKPAPTHTAAIVSGVKKPPGAKGARLEALLGMWKAEGSGRLLKAVKDGDEVDFKVVRPDEFKGAYAKDEVRFSLKIGDEDTSYYVIDRYRPNPTPHKYGPDGMATCLTEFTTDDKGQTLTGILKSENALEVQLVVSTIVPNPPVDGEITGCSAGKFSSISKTVFRRTDDEE